VGWEVGGHWRGVTRQAALRWVTGRPGPFTRARESSLIAPREGRRGTKKERMPRPGQVAESALLRWVGQRQSTAIAAFARVSTPIDQKTGGGTLPVLRWRPAPMPSRAPMTMRITSFTPILT
jgi:hypothetical protein